MVIVDYKLPVNPSRRRLRSEFLSAQKRYLKARCVQPVDQARTRISTYVNVVIVAIFIFIIILCRLR